MSRGETAPDGEDLPGSGPRVEIGVLVPVPEPLSGRVRALRTAIGDPRGGPIPPHVTVVPPTEIDAAALPAIVEHLSTVAALGRPFEVHLQGTRTFQPVTDVVYLAVVGGAEELDDVQDAVRRGPLAVDLRYPYHPHVTLAHDVPQAGLDRARSEMADVDERFTVGGFVLYAHPVEAPWEIVGTFALGS
ncbi:2'-5' RNA ligase family protein [Mobilicoccus pelagius]|uniref:2'-5' RNA ligase n=1 Tax=Mobilicoccus pelagius NBRC 104925 TaxID=1089455 RepID=H5UU17_9MICO|nr:2'-5' RNA ligase family protein [Mobilicoccus pelagius]GAB49225.1 hypothetical protein MOPEL_099_00250 [Mobilicoccus pelagius NBRC 104925]